MSNELQVINGEVVEDRRHPVIAATHRVVTHDVTRSAARNVSYVFGGAWVIGQRWWLVRSLTTRMLRTHEQAGNLEEMHYWHEKDEQSRASRHKRRMDLLTFPLHAARAVFVAMAVWFVLLVVFGVVMWASGQGSPFGPALAFAHFVGFMWWAVTTGWVAILIALGCATVFVLWRVGKQVDAAPAWLAPQAVTGRVMDNGITPARVVLALRELGITSLRKSITGMEDGGASMLSSIAIAGCGMEVDVTLPEGTSTQEVLDKRLKLAENLDRHKHEVHLLVAPKPRTVRIWAADPGALDEPVGISPLVFDPDLRADYKRGKCPWGVNLRGDPVAVSLYQRHVLVTGQSNQGKTWALRALALWLSLDRNVAFRVTDLKGDGDWKAFRNIAEVFIEGPSDDDVISATEMLEDCVTEMNRRLADNALPRPPLVAIVDEAQKAYMCPAIGADGRPYGGARNTSRFLTAVRQIQNQGRAVNVTVWQGTQDPTAQNLPPLAREGAHLRGCLAVGKAEKSRMALGDKAADGGAAPHLLRPGLDKGTLVIAGDGAPLTPGMASETVRTFPIDDKSAKEVAARAVSLRGPVIPLDPEEQRDVLQDVHEALRSDRRVKAADMPARLREMAPNCRAYRSLNGERLVEQLRSEGCVVKKYKGTDMITAERVLRAIDFRNGVKWPDEDEG